MKPGSVLVDLAVESGGNVEGSKLGKMVDARAGSRSSATPTCPRALAPATSALYARNLLNFVEPADRPGVQGSW